MHFSVIIIFITNLFVISNLQLKRGVADLTATFLSTCRGDAKKAASLISAFVSQRLVQPFMYSELETPSQKFGCNVKSTLLALKKHNACRKPGGPADMMRRSIIASGASGPLAPDKVCCIYLFNTMHSV